MQLTVEESGSGYVNHDAWKNASTYSPGSTPEEEVAAILTMLQGIQHTDVGYQIETCMGLMARLTELKVYCLTNEGRDRKLKVLRLTKLTPTIELVDFIFRGASRLVEVKRLEVELSK